MSTRVVGGLGAGRFPSSSGAEVAVEGYRVRLCRFLKNGEAFDVSQWLNLPGWLSNHSPSQPRSSASTEWWEAADRGLRARGFWGGRPRVSDVGSRGKDSCPLQGTANVHHRSRGPVAVSCLSGMVATGMVSPPHPAAVTLSSKDS